MLEDFATLEEAQQWADAEDGLFIFRVIYRTPVGRFAPFIYSDHVNKEFVPSEAIQYGWERVATREWGKSTEWQPV